MRQIITMFLLLLPLSSFAATSSLFDGPYIGLGYSMVNTQIKANGVFSLHADENSAISLVSRAENHSSNPGATFNIGFAKTFYKLYLGAEAFAAISSNNKTKYIHSTFDFSYLNFHLNYAKMHANYAFGANFKVGITPTHNSLIYALIGVEHMQFGIEPSNADVAATGYPSSGITDTGFTASSTAFTPGFGVAIFLTKHLLFNTQYTYARFKTITHSFAGKVYVPGYTMEIVPADVHYSVKPSINTYTASFIWVFNNQ